LGLTVDVVDLLRANLSFGLARTTTRSSMIGLKTLIEVGCGLGDDIVIFCRRKIVDLIGDLDVYRSIDALQSQTMTFPAGG